MAMVETVRGSVEAAHGRVLMHEHVFVLGTEIQQNYPGSWDEEARAGGAVRQLRRSGSAASAPWPAQPAGPGPLSAPDPADQRAGGHHHHPGGRPVHLQFSPDAWCRTGWFPGPVRALVAPGRHCNHVTGDVPPALRERGVTGEQITTMLVDNPRRYCEVKA